MQQLQALIFPLALLAFFYFFLIKPQQKRQKELTMLRENLRIGDVVVTIGGLEGTVVQVREATVVLEIEPDGTKLTFERWAIGKLKEAKVDTEVE
ncbi:MAG: preprotein translocase subunit YajC [Peptoclostridium sp.]|uniref:preprotein translocase subunit YajC n=1 Tax=Peptoclostridium sp. TaxID=1904860 RepID=UPI00139D8477|nr:preprotein translocase subunit YajC [Peptoclostridium sp.]MZQ76144.1 preprotein translocase subunit YajC [Peptoclostridium sp.]